VRAQLCGFVCLMHSCMRQLSLFQWLCNADKRSHEPRCVLNCVGLYVSCTHACDSFLSFSGCAMQTSAAMSPGACSIVWGCMSHACSSFLSPSGCAMQTSAATSEGTCLVWVGGAVVRRHMRPAGNLSANLHAE